MTNCNNFCKNCNKSFGINNQVLEMMHLYFCNNKCKGIYSQDEIQDINTDILQYLACVQLLNQIIDDIKYTNTINSSDMYNEIINIKKYFAVLLNDFDLTDPFSEAICQTMKCIIATTDEHQYFQLLVLLSLFRKIQSNQTSYSNHKLINKIFTKFLYSDCSDIFIFMKLTYLYNFKNAINNHIHAIPTHQFKKLIKSIYKLIKNNQVQTDELHTLLKNKAKQINHSNKNNSNYTNNIN